MLLTGILLKCITEVVILVDDLAMKLEAMSAQVKTVEQTIINNNLLTTCTFTGVTDNWLETTDGTDLYIDGKTIFTQLY